jgi:hypothetical protein
MGRDLFRHLVALAMAFILWTGATAAACPFCNAQGQTLTGEVNQAAMVLFGTLTNAKLDPNGGYDGTTDLRIEAVIKKHEILADRKVITLSRYVPVNNDKTKFLVLCDVFKGKIDAYRGFPVKADSDIVKYLKGALEVKDKDIGTRLRFYFDYLDNADLEVSNDAYKEYANADYKDYRPVAVKLPAAKMAKWLQDPDTPAFRYGLYASLLGHCGSEKDAELLRKLLDDPQRRLSSGVDGILAGYTMLQPKEGWAYVRSILKDPSKEFMLRYAALRAVRFFWDYRPDLVNKKDLVDGVCLLLDQGDIADLAIEDLRKWGRWEVTDQVCALYAKKTHDIPIMRRTIVRFALSAKANKFIEEVRGKDPEMVKEVEELLQLDTAAQAAKPVVNKEPPK